MSMGVGQIPWNSIVEYYRIFIDPNGAHTGNRDFEDFYYLIRLMDDKMVELQNNKNEKKSKPQGKGK